MMKTYKEMPKQYIGLITDHSGSMQGLAKQAMNDYNNNISAIREQTEKHSLDTIIYTVLCGGNNDSWPTSAKKSFSGINGVEIAVVNSTVSLLQPNTSYETFGQTPLFDSVGTLIELMERVPDADSPNVSFLIIAITDGQENASNVWTATKLKNKILSLQNSDRWSFTFRVPSGYAKFLSDSLGIHLGNFYEWDGHSAVDMAKSQIMTTQAVKNFYTTRTVGKTSTSSFYTNLSGVTSSVVSKNLTDITDRIKVFNITPKFHDIEIRDFVKSRRKGAFVQGTSFYELTKREKIQAYKQVIIQDKKTGKFYGGQKARTMLGFPSIGTLNVNPGEHGNFKIFIQSTSTNRKLKANTKLLIWQDAGYQLENLI